MDDDSFYRKDTPFNEAHHSRLPHRWQNGVLTFVTWHLNDSIPREMVKEVEVEAERRHLQRCRAAGRPDAAGEDRVRHSTHRLDQFLDSGHGSSVLRRPDACKLMADTLHSFDGERYLLDCYVIMPNHVHLACSLIDEFPLPKVVQSWKGYSAHQLVKMCGLTAPIWQEGYWDRLIRNHKHLSSVRTYIANNPLKAGLRDGEYRFWSAPKPDEEVGMG